MKRVLLPLALAAAITVPVGAQYGWFQLNGGLIARLSSSETAATIRQDGAGAVLDLYAGTTRIFRATSTAITSSIAALFADGTAAAPSITFASDTDTGIYSAGANSIGQTIGGAPYSYFDGASHVFRSSTQFGWSSGSPGLGLDTIISRNAAAGAFRFGNTANANTFDITLADWGTLNAAETITVADNGTVDLTVGGLKPVGILYVTNLPDTRGCAFQLRGGSNAVDEITAFDIGGFCTTTAGTATSVNVYWDAVDLRYELQNTRGGARDFKLVIIGGSQ